MDRRNNKEGLESRSTHRAMIHYCMLYHAKASQLAGFHMRMLQSIVFEATRICSVIDSGYYGNWIRLRLTRTSEALVAQAPVLRPA